MILVGKFLYLYQTHDNNLFLRIKQPSLIPRKEKISLSLGLQLANDQDSAIHDLSRRFVLSANGRDHRDIFHHRGMEVDFPPDQTCCAQPNFKAALRAEECSIAEHIIRLFERTNGDIVTPSGSCAHMFKQGFPELFQDDPGWLPPGSPRWPSPL